MPCFGRFAWQVVWRNLTSTVVFAWQAFWHLMALGGALGLCLVVPRDVSGRRGTLPKWQASVTTWGWIRATTFEGTLQGGLEGSLPGGGGGHEGEKGLKPP